MKNFKIAMILVAAVAFFCSCGEKTVTVNVTEKNDVVTYDLSSAASLPIELTCTVNADAGIKTIELSRTIMNGETVVKTEAYELENADFEGKADFSFPWADTLLKADLAAGYTVEYKVTAADKKDNQDSKIYPINVVETATPISANWQGPIYLAHPSTSSYASINGTNVRETESTIIGVKVIENNTSNQTKIGVTTNCEGFVVVTEDYASVEELEAAYTAGSAATSIWLDAEFHAKNYAEKKFIAKVDNAYVLVKYTSGDICPNGWNNIAGNVYGFEYKKAETTPAAAK